VCSAPSPRRRSSAPSREAELRAPRRPESSPRPARRRRGGRPWDVVAAAALTLLLTTAALSCAAPAGAASASPYEYGEVLRFGGFDSKAYDGGNYEHEPTPGKFLDPTGFAVDPVDNTVYVLDRTSTWETNPTAWRIQQFKSDGELEGTTTFTLPNVSTFTDLETDAVAGLAVDHRAGRLYALVIGSPPTSSPHPGTTVAQELLAWSTTPEEGKLVAAPEHEPNEFNEDPLKTGGALISDSSQLKLKGGIPLYGPEGIAIDRTEIAGVDNPVVVEASDYNTETGRGAPVIGDTIVQQVATQRQEGVQVGDLLASWSSASVATTLGGVSWGPHGIFDNPDGTISVLLDADGTFATDTNVVRLGPNLSGAVVVNSDADAPASNDYDEAALSGDAEGPFNALAGVGISYIYGAGPDVAQLSSVSGEADGPYVADIFAKEQADIQFSSQGPGPEYWTEGEPEHHVKPNIGIRLLRPEADGAISNPRGGTIVNTLGNNQPGEPCNIGAAEATLAAGADGTLWVLARGPESFQLSASKAVPGREIIELAPRTELPPGDERLCPQPSGTFTMGVTGGPSQSAEGPPLEVPAGTQVTFDAGSSIMVNSEPIATGKTGKPFAYEWDFEGAAGQPIVIQKIEQMKLPEFHFPSQTITYRYTKPGTYTVTARLLSDYGSYTTTSGTVVVTHDPNGGPHPQFTAAPAGGQQIAFDASGSTPGIGTIVHYTWNWGDGSPLENEEAQTPAVTHTYASPGAYQVTLTVTNSAYQSTTSAPQMVLVEAAAPAASVLPGPLYAIPLAPLYEIPGAPSGKRSFDLGAHARFAHGALEVKLSCPKGAGVCAGAVQAQTASRYAMAAGRAKRGGHAAKPRRLSLGQAAFHLAAGRQGTVAIRISAQGLALLEKLKRLSVLVSVTARDGAGEQGAQTLRLVLSAPASAARAHSHKRR
jgi:PKD repeat protein